MAKLTNIEVDYIKAFAKNFKDKTNIDISVDKLLDEHFEYNNLRIHSTKGKDRDYDSKAIDAYIELYNTMKYGFENDDKYKKMSEQDRLKANGEFELFMNEYFKYGVEPDLKPNHPKVIFGVAEDKHMDVDKIIENEINGIISTKPDLKSRLLNEKRYNDASLINVINTANNYLTDDKINNENPTEEEGKEFIENIKNLADGYRTAKEHYDKKWFFMKWFSGKELRAIQAAEQKLTTLKNADPDMAGLNLNDYLNRFDEGYETLKYNEIHDTYAKYVLPVAHPELHTNDVALDIKTNIDEKYRKIEAEKAKKKMIENNKLEEAKTNALSQKEEKELADMKKEYNEIHKQIVDAKNEYLANRDDRREVAKNRSAYMEHTFGGREAELMVKIDDMDPEYFKDAVDKDRLAYIREENAEKETDKLNAERIDPFIENSVDENLRFTEESQKEKQVSSAKPSKYDAKKLFGSIAVMRWQEAKYNSDAREEDVDLYNKLTKKNPEKCDSMFQEQVYNKLMSEHMSVSEVKKLHDDEYEKFKAGEMERDSKKMQERLAKETDSIGNNNVSEKKKEIDAPVVTNVLDK